VVMTAVQIGNVGTNLEDTEARRVACAGLAIRELSPLAASWRSEASLPVWLEKSGLPGIDGIDTRALTRVLRDEGAMRGAITPHVGEIPAVLDRVRAAPKMDGQDLVPRVTCSEPYEWTKSGWFALDDGRAIPPPPIRFHVVAYDFGIKENILRQLRDLGARVTVVPASTPAAKAIALAPDGFFLSNGPGDPEAVTYGVVAAKELCASGKPVFGICLGHQILGLALGGKTQKLSFGHHGGNHPVLDKTTGKVEITSQNHGFVVDVESLPSGVHVTHENLFDHSNEGLAVDGKPIFSVQYHPEASPGPHDAHYLFARFRDLLERSR
jgi:carbamoyl-phosphate synthase small subunit